MNCNSLGNWRNVFSSAQGTAQNVFIFRLLLKITVWLVPANALSFFYVGGFFYQQYFLPGLRKVVTSILLFFFLDLAFSFFLFLSLCCFVCVYD